jgi:hypothetical protein
MVLLTGGEERRGEERRSQQLHDPEHNENFDDQDFSYTYRTIVIMS